MTHLVAIDVVFGRPEGRLCTNEIIKREIYLHETRKLTCHETDKDPTLIGVTLTPAGGDEGGSIFVIMLNTAEGLDAPSSFTALSEAR